MPRSLVPVVSLVVLVSCTSCSSCSPPAPEARRMLESSEPLKRQEGARALQRMYAKDPTSIGDHGEAYWVERCARARGKTASVAAEILDHPQVSGGEAGGGGVNETYRLDPFWITSVGRSTRGDDTIFAIDPPRRVVVHIDLQPPAKLTGTWTTYYVNGAVYEAAEIEGGVYRRDRVFHDNGKLRYESAYVDGKIDGLVVYRDVQGAPEWERTFVKGKQVGVDRTFYPSGKLKQEAHYTDDKLDGLLESFSESGAITYCASYEAGVQVDGGCNQR